MLASVDPIIKSKGNVKNAEDSDDDDYSNNTLFLYRNALKMYCFLITAIIDAAEHQKNMKEEVLVPLKKKGAKKAKVVDDGFDWDTIRNSISGLLSSVMSHSSLFSLWSMGAPEEELGNVLFRAAMQIFESETFLKSV